jgi:dsRNA-specific ribonuclease
MYNQQPQMYNPYQSTRGNQPRVLNRNQYQMQPEVAEKKYENVKNVKVDNKIDDIIVAQAGSFKSMKRKYVLSEPLPNIINDNKINEYRQFIINLLTSRGKMRLQDAELYTDNNCMPLFIQAITHDSVNPKNRADNYEMYEHFGDATCNKCATWYLKNRFLDIVKRGDEGVQYISKQKSIITSKPYLAKYNDEIGFSNFIRYRPLEFEYTKDSGNIAQAERHKKTITIDRSMKEDVFEAFFGCLEDVIDKKEGVPGVGYSVVYTILSSIWDEKYIPSTKNELIDAKTQLKEIFDKRKINGDKIDYVTDKDTKEVTLVVVLNKPGSVAVKLTYQPAEPFKTIIQETTILQFGPLSTNVAGDGYDYETNKKIIEQKLARDALTYLAEKFGDEFRRYKADE